MGPYLRYKSTKEINMLIQIIGFLTIVGMVGGTLYMIFKTIDDLGLVEAIEEFNRDQEKEHSHENQD